MFNFPPPEHPAAIRIGKSVGYAAVFFAAFQLFSSSAFPQGSLTPPAGSPAPTMKSLDQIASTGIAINATNTPGDGSHHFIINSPGSYFFPGNIAVTQNVGIEIASSNVTVDLNGFQLLNTGASTTGFEIGASAHNCTIKNGTIASFISHGIASLFTNLDSAHGVALSNLSVSNCSSTGIVAGNFALVQDCRVHDNGGGISMGDACILINCNASGNHNTGIISGTNCILIGCNASENTLTQAGIQAGNGCTLADCTATGNSSGLALSFGISAGSNCTLTNCSASSNTNTNGSPSSITGIGISVADYSIINNCSATQNKGDGIEVGANCQLIGCNSSGNGNGANGSGILGNVRVLVKNCAVADNRKHGIIVGSGSSVLDSDAHHNGLGGAFDGINAAGSSLIQGNSVSTNGGDGIHVTGSLNRIDNNLANSNGGWGIHGGADFIIRNCANSNAGATGNANYNPSTGTNIGPLQTANSSTPSPWANLQ